MDRERDRTIDSPLRELKELLMGMSGWVEKAIGVAITSLLESDPEKLVEVHRIETEVNQAHIKIDDACVKLLALQQPLAKDLRLIVAVLKINTDLERMGDQAVNIAHNAKRYLKGNPFKPLVDLPTMFQEVQWMVHQSIQSFVIQNTKGMDLAKEVLKRDDKVDALKNKIFLDVIEIMKTEPSKIEQGLSLILIARNLERIGDHATNIAEDNIFVISGSDIRHSKKGSL